MLAGFMLVKGTFAASSAYPLKGRPPATAVDYACHVKKAPPLPQRVLI
jgi:hypothetical protein